MKRTGWFYRRLRTGFLFLLDLATKNKGVRVNINDFSLRLPGLYSRYYPKDYEKENFEFIKNTFRPGMTGIDIGAHLGIYSVRMAQLGASRVFSFEPTPSTRKKLKKVIELNNFKEIITISGEAIGERSGKATFHLNEPVNKESRMSVAEANSLKFIDHGDHIQKKEFVVDVLSLDDFIKKSGVRADFIKIDTEGSEMDILRSSVNTIKKYKPAIIISFHCFTYKNPEQELLAFWDLFQQLQLLPQSGNRAMTRGEFMNLGRHDIFDLQFHTA